MSRVLRAWLGVSTTALCNLKSSISTAKTFFPPTASHQVRVRLPSPTQAHNPHQYQHQCQYQHRFRYPRFAACDYHQGGSRFERKGEGEPGRPSSRRPARDVPGFRRFTAVRPFFDLFCTPKFLFRCAFRCSVCRISYIIYQI